MKTENFSGSSTGLFSFDFQKPFGRHSKWMMGVAAFSFLMMAGCEDGEDGTSVTVETTSFTGAEGDCTNGGIKLKFTSGTTETEKYVCNGEAGKGVNIETTSFTGAEGDCTNGGLKITVTSGTSVTEKYVCNGVDGEGNPGQEGSDGHSSLVNVKEYNGAQCLSGEGIKIESGIDSNDDGHLDADEVTTTKYVCNGVDGNNTNPCSSLSSDPECTGGAEGGVMTCTEANVSTSTELVVCNAHKTCPGILLFDIDATAPRCTVHTKNWDHSETWTGLPADGGYKSSASFNSQDISGLTWHYSGQAKTDFENSDVKTGILMNKESTRYLELAITKGIGKMEFVWGRGGASTIKAPKVKISTDGSNYTDVEDTVCDIQNMATTTADPKIVRCTFNRSGTFKIRFTPQAETLCHVIIGEVNWDDYD